MPSIEARSKLRLVLHCNECASSSQKGARWDMSARSQLERSGRFTVGSGEVAHLFRRLGARTLKMLSVKRGRAGRLDAGWLPISSAVDRHTAERVLAQCAKTLSGAVRHRAREMGSHPSQSPLERQG